ncbi:MAG TPA: 2-oxoglutarate dehydrogenase, E2 component, dihydrolipoamide succinyltransferase, partial [Acidobacteriaceae bacterium]|nr:2-oxoglutarate dehydrogenase, E2 component, dihydrolipoamide succinyltransferase [Acidobacteriaceae bacterium]
MPTDVVMPQMGESITEGTLTKWLKKPGDTVQRDEPLFEISTDKVDAEIPSPVAGTLGEIKVQEGATVGINTVVATINEGGAAAAAAPASSGAVPTKEDTVTPAAVDTAARDQKATQEALAPSSGNGATSGATAGPGTEVLMPQMGESITEGTITKWLKMVGDTVQRDEPIFEISTDKVDAEIPSPAAGTLTEIKVPEGSTVSINTVVAVIGGGAGAPAATRMPTPATPGAAPSTSVSSRPEAPRAGVERPAVPTAAAAGERPRSSPLVRKIAAENNVDLSSVPGTGASGRITKQDISAHITGGGAAAAAPAPAAPAPAAAAPAAAPAKPAAPVSAPLPGTLEPMSKMRSIIAKRMVESKHTNAHVHTIFKVDMTRIVRLREKEKNKYEQRNGVKLTYMPFITRAAVQALRKHPIVNATAQAEAILYNKNINIGIAVALEWGLIVPVIKQAEEKSFLGITRSIVDLADRARSKKLAPD